MRALSTDELQKLFSAARTPRDLALLRVLYSTGLRIFECQKLTISELKDHDGNLRDWIVVKGKRKRIGQVHLDELARACLQRYLLERGEWIDGIEALWVTHKRPYRQLTKRMLQKIVYQTSIRAGLQPLYPHTIRATFITDLERQKTSLSLIQRAARHADARTTLRYIVISDSEMREAVEANHSRV